MSFFVDIVFEKRQLHVPPKKSNICKTQNTIQNKYAMRAQIKAIVIAGQYHLFYLNKGIDIVMRRCRLKEYGVKVYRVICTEGFVEVGKRSLDIKMIDSKKGGSAPLLKTELI